MKVRICAVGRSRSGPERALADDYLDRFARVGGNVGLGPARVTEVDAKGAGRDAESALLERAASGAVWTLDERGEALTSPGFARALAEARDGGVRELSILIGGADGLAEELRSKSRLSVSFGRMVWPHMLARAMLAEQLYRAASILAGGPYHRE